MTISLRLPKALMVELHEHLFPGDSDEHGAVIAASVISTERGMRLLAHRVFIARDGVDYVNGQRGYKMLTATFVMDAALECASLGMAYLAVHCHRGKNQVSFSSDDMASHERGYPALLDILDGQPVGALVLAENAIAGDIWFANGERRNLEETIVTGRPLEYYYDSPSKKSKQIDERFDRQARLFGDRGQLLLKTQKVGVIGAGGAGSLVVEYLTRLGVGEVVIIDPDRIEPSNLPRVVGSKLKDTLPWITDERIPVVIRSKLLRFRKPKVKIAARQAKGIGVPSKITPLILNVSDKIAVRSLKDCDYLFLAADSMQARLIFNALVHQYLIAGVQMGAKAQVDKKTGSIVDLFVVVRPLIPGVGCLWCNGLILPSRLQEEATSSEQIKKQRYIEEDNIRAPSVKTLNAVGAAGATNDYLMTTTGLLEYQDVTWQKIYPRKGTTTFERVRKDITCGECTFVGRLGKGDTKSLPIKQ